MSAERVQAVIDAHPDRWRAVPVVAAGCGLRQGEAFGVRVEDVVFLRRQLLVRQQIKVVKGRATRAPPKRRKTRDVPLSDTVAEELAERIRQHPPGESGLVFTTREGGPLTRSYYNRYVWRPALETVGVERSRANGMHALRHFYASSLLSQGVSIRAVAAFLGHEDPGFTLRVYGNLMEGDDDRARAAVDVALGRRADNLRTNEAE